MCNLGSFDFLIVSTILGIVFALKQNIHMVRSSSEFFFFNLALDCFMRAFFYLLVIFFQIPKIVNQILILLIRIFAPIKE